MPASGWQPAMARFARRAAAKRSLAPPRRRTSSSTRRWSGSGSAIPRCAGSTCWSCSPSSAPRDSRCRRASRLSRALGLDPPASEAEAAASLQLDRRALARDPCRSGLARARRGLDRRMRRCTGWLGLGAADRRSDSIGPSAASGWLFSRLKQWDEAGERPPPRTIRLDPAEMRATRLDRADRRAPSRARGSARWPKRSTQRLRARSARGRAQLAARRGRHGDRQDARLSRAGVAVGGAGRAATVWVSTFTKALQRQLDAEGRKLFADADERARRIVMRKGRENYLCLLNLEDALQGAFAGRAAILAQLVGRWAAYTKDGDMVGGDLPGWLPSLFRRAGSTALTDRRGECVYAGCPHYRSCFIERAERASREADIVIANHALVMVNAARGREDAPGADPVRRGASSVRSRRFDLRGRVRRAGGDRAAALDRRAGGPFARAAARAGGAADGRRVLRRGRRRGRSRRRSRRRGRCRRTAGCSGWPRARRSARSRPCSREVRGMVYARAEGAGGRLRAGDRARRARRRAGVERAAAAMRGARSAAQAAGGAWRGGSRRCSRMRPTGSTRRRARGSKARSAGCRWRRETLAAWIALLARIGGEADPEFVDWLAVERIDGREYRYRHPSPLARPDQPARRDRARARRRRAGHLGDAARRRGLGRGRGADRRRAPRRSRPAFRGARARSTMPRCSEVLIVTDVKQGDIAALAGAYARLIEAARRRHARAVHRDPAAARRSMPGSPTGSRAPACRCSRSMSIRSTPARWSTSSATIRAPRCSAPMRCATASTCPANRCGWW